MNKTRRTLGGPHESTCIVKRRNNKRLKAILAIFVLKQLIQPGLFVADCPADIIAEMEELVDDVGANVAIGAGDEDEGGFGEGEICGSHCKDDFYYD